MDPTPPALDELLDGIEAIVLDMDGTLVDSAAPIAAGVNALRAAIDLEPLPVADVAGRIGGGLGGLLRGSLPAAAHDRIDSLRPVFHRAYAARMLDSRPLPGAHALVGHLAGRPAGIVTNKPRQYLDPLLDHLGWRLAVTIAGDDGLGRKPAPDPLWAAAKRLGIDPAAMLFVGDTTLDRQAARAAGTRFVAVPGAPVELEPRITSLEALCRWA